MLVDCGSGTLLQLERAKKSYKDIDAVFITHTHPDHISDLISLIHALRATPDYKREKDLRIVGSNGLKKFYNRCIASCIKSPKTFHIDLVEIEDKLDLGQIRIFSVETIHSKDSIAYLWQDLEKE